MFTYAYAAALAPAEQAADGAVGPLAVRLPSPAQLLSCQLLLP